MDATNGNASHAAAPADDAGRRPLGEIFVELGFITRAQLDAALAEQQRTGARIGEILVAQGGLTRLDLATALAEHWEPHAYPETGTVDLEATDDARPATIPAHVEPEPAPVPDPVSPPAPDATRVALAELEARLDALAVLVAGLRTDVSGLVERGAGDDLGEVPALRVETASLAGRLDELFGLRHSDAHLARAANEKLDRRLTALVDARARATEAALLERLDALGAQLIRSAERNGKPGKKLRRSIEALTAAITDAQGEIEEPDRRQRS